MRERRPAPWLWTDNRGSRAAAAWGPAPRAVASSRAADGAHRRGGTARSRAPWHRFREHTSEVRLQVGAPDLAELAAEAGRALAGLLLRGAPPAAPEGPWHEISVTARDREALLVDWLNEILYLAETERWVPVEIDVEEATPTWLVARARGMPVAEAPAAVKAATYHGLRVVEDPAGGFEAEVIFDV